MKNLILALFILLVASCSKPQPQVDPIINTIDSVQWEDRLILLDEFGDTAVLYSRAVEDSIIINCYQINDTMYVVFKHDLETQSSEETWIYIEHLD